MEQIRTGVWKLTFGEPETHTPLSLLAETGQIQAHEMPAEGNAPFSDADIRFRQTARGCVLDLPFSSHEKIYGFGLQLKELNATLRKKLLRVNSDPVSDTGDSHAPVPFYVSTAGYGVYVDTARTAAFYVATHTVRGAGRKTGAARSDTIADNTSDLYAFDKILEDTTVHIEIPAARGVDVYLFEGPGMREAVQRYNLFSGGGCLPPLWGLGVWYRIYGRADSSDAHRLAKELRDTGIPCDVLGLEPGWQSHSYSCSFQWDKVRFPDHEGMLEKLRGEHFHVNLWEHAYVHPTADFYEKLFPHSGDTEVWGGLVPDFADPQARAIFADYHAEQLAGKGISGFKLDECDGSDYNVSNWAFPDGTEFPSGLDGEQMHAMFGLLYQLTLYGIYRKAGVRTLGQVRSSGAMATSLPFVLYSDLYDHRDFIRGLVGTGFSGMLWSPEVRGCVSAEDLIRRLQSVVYSPQALINAWMIPSPPWEELDFKRAGDKGPLADPEEVRAVCRRILQERMSLLPYLYTAFADYYFRGLPPFRALVMDYPDDAGCYDIEDEYMVGDALLVAPLVAGESGRSVYLPRGEWCDFRTGRRYAGGRSHTVLPALDEIPVFVKYGSVIPWAKPMPYVADDTVFDVKLRSYGAGSCTLYEDDGVSFAYESGAYRLLHIEVKEDGSWSSTPEGTAGGERYRIAGVQRLS